MPLDVSSSLVAPVEPIEAANVAAQLSEKQQMALVDSCIRDFEDALRGRSKRMQKLKEFTELYSGLLRAKTFPHTKAANVNLNVLSYTSLQTHARLYDMIWPDNGKVIYSWPSTVEDFARASITEKFANSYIRNKMPEMAQGLDDSLAQLVIYGSAFRHTYWDSYDGRARSDWIPVEDFVVNHQFRSQDPSMRDVPCYSRVTHPTLSDLKMRGDRGVYVNTEKLAAETTDDSYSALRDVVQKSDGTSAPGNVTEDDRPRLVFEQHRTWKLADGKVHYIAATIDKQSQTLLRLIVREEDDPEDAKRFERESVAYQEFLIKAAAYEQQVAAAATVTTTAPPGAFLPGPGGAVPPVPVNEPAPVRQREICFFTHYKAFPSEGFYGLGFGDFVAPLNKAANTLLNQHIDGVTLRNARPGFISRSMRFQRGTVNVQPGALIEVDAPPAVIKDGITFLDPPLNDPTTMPLIRLLVEIADKFAGNSDMMSGSGGDRRTAKEAQILNAQLMKQISILAKRVREAQKHEFDKLWRLWGTFLPDEPEQTDVIDPLTGGPERIPVSRRMFVPDARIFPAADPRMRFEKIEEAMQKFAIVTQNPMLMQNPAILRAVTEDVLKAHDAERLIAYLPPMQGPPQQPQPKQAFEEEAGWMRSEDSQVHPADDDAWHMDSHMAFLQQSPSANMPPEMGGMSKAGRDMALNHIRSHQAAHIEKRGQALTQQMGPPPMPGAGNG